MTKRTSAADATFMPANGPNRRALLTSGATASLIASTAAALPVADPDATLWLLREKWHEALRARDAALDVDVQVEERTFTPRPRLPEWATWPGDWACYEKERACIMQQHIVISAEEGQQEADRLERETARAEAAAVERIAAKPARTMAGLRFKIEVSAEWDHSREDIRDAIIADVLAFAATHPALALPA